MTTATIDTSVAELDIALVAAIRAATDESSAAFQELALRCPSLDKVIHQLLAHSNIPEAVMFGIYTGILVERQLAANRANNTEILTGVEFGYRACEQGQNLQAAIASAVEVLG